MNSFVVTFTDLITSIQERTGSYERYYIEIILSIYSKYKLCVYVSSRTGITPVISPMNRPPQELLNMKNRNHHPKYPIL